jgi:hypothetical protein
MAIRNRRARPCADDAAPHFAVWTMLAAFVALVFVKLGGWGFPTLLHDRDFVTFGWGCALAATLPLYLQFASTRYATAGARVAFGAAIAAHLLAQIIAAACMLNGTRDGAETSFVELAAILGVAVPLWIVWRQHVLKRKLLAA